MNVAMPMLEASIDQHLQKVDVMATVSRVLAEGPRGAIAASTVEIMAMARLAMDLCAITDLTFEMFKTADAIIETRDQAARAGIKHEVSDQIAVIGALLEKLGYGRSTTTPTENSNV